MSVSWVLKGGRKDGDGARAGGEKGGHGNGQGGGGLCMSACRWWLCRSCRGSAQRRRGSTGARASSGGSRVPVRVCGVRGRWGSTGPKRRHAMDRRHAWSSAVAQAVARCVARFRMRVCQTRAPSPCQWPTQRGCRDAGEGGGARAARAGAPESALTRFKFEPVEKLNCTKKSPNTKVVGEIVGHDFHEGRFSKLTNV